MATTPGVTFKEISTIAPSVAEVATAIPAFVGYAEKTPTPPRPVRIRSMREFETSFGGCVEDTIELTEGQNNIATQAEGTNTLTNELAFKTPKWLLWHSMQLYFMNGGGPCWVHAKEIGTKEKPDEKDLITLLRDFEKISEPTLLVCPDAVNSTDRAAVYNAMQKQCTDLKDRFCIFDAIGTTDKSRDGLPASSSYAATYYPLLNCSLPFYGDASENNATLEIIETTGVQQVSKALTAWDTAESAHRTFMVRQDYTTCFPIPSLYDTIAKTLDQNTDGQSLLDKLNDTTNKKPLSEYASAIPAETLCNLVDNELKRVLTLEEDQLNVLANASISAINSPQTPPTLTDILSAYFKALNQAKNRRELARTLEGSKDAVISAIAKKKPRRKQLTRSDELINATPDKDDRSTWEIIRNTRTLLPPSAAIAGIYASVDRTRGVWKAPANVALSGVIGPSVELSAEEHGGLNEDAQNGKSINVIKSNSAGDVLVMGARTMDGNSNEWRFVSTRRFFIMVEESIANSVQWAVFEPNDANTWARVQSSVENFLTQKWREGALFGGSPAEAFSVSVGLGRTMTADDILNGIMRVNIAMRVVTPAEVVELRFSHKIIK